METDHLACTLHCTCYCVYCYVLALCRLYPSLLTDDGLSVVTSNVVESDAITIEVVQDSHTELISLPVIRLSSASSENIHYFLSFDQNLWDTHPPVWDQLTLVYDLPLGHVTRPPLILPPVQKYFCPSLATRLVNSLSLALLSMLMGLIPFDRQNDSPCPSVKEEQPSLQLMR